MRSDSCMPGSHLGTQSTLIFLEQWRLYAAKWSEEAIRTAAELLGLALHLHRRRLSAAEELERIRGAMVG